MAEESEKADKKNQRKLHIWKDIQTIWLLLSFVLPGISDTTQERTLLDLELLLPGENNMPLVILLTRVGVGVGSIVAVAFVEIDIKLRLAISLLLESIITMVTPQVLNFTYVVVMFTLQGVTRGLVFVFLIERCSTLWRDKPTLYQLILIGPVAGSVIGPYILQPFLCQRQHLRETPTVSHLVSRRNHTNITNITNDDRIDVCTPLDTNVQSAYLVLGGVNVPCAVAFAYYYILFFSKRSPRVLQPDPIVVTIRPTWLVTDEYLYYTLRSFIFLYFLPVAGNVTFYTTYLSKFGTRAMFHFTKEEMEKMTFLVYQFALTGVIVNNIVAMYLGTFFVLALNGMVLMTSGVLLLTIASHKNERVFMICSGMFGLVSSPFVGAGIAWISEHVTLTQRIVSISVFSMTAGNILIPFIGGLLMDEESVDSFVYIVFFTCLIQCVVFGELYCLGQLHRVTNKPSDKERIIDHERIAEN